MQATQRILVFLFVCLVGWLSIVALKKKKELPLFWWLKAVTILLYFKILWVRHSGRAWPDDSSAPCGIHGLGLLSERQPWAGLGWAGLRVRDDFSHIPGALMEQSEGRTHLAPSPSLCSQGLYLWTLTG